MAFKYRWDGSNNTAIPDAGVEVHEGDEFESPVELNHPHATLLSGEAGAKAVGTKAAATPNPAPGGPQE